MQCDFSASSARVSYLGGDSRGAVGFQRNVLEQLGFQELSGAMPVIERISEANPGLELERVLRQDVTALRFRHVS